jgi:hypothetical protein
VQIYNVFLLKSLFLHSQQIELWDLMTSVQDKELTGHFVIPFAASVSRWPMTSLRSTAIGGDLIVKPSDEHLWFGQPKIVLHLVHLIIFQNAFELAYFFYVLVSMHCDTTFCKVLF